MLDVPRTSTSMLKKKINKETEKSKYFFLAAIDYV